MGHRNTWLHCKNALQKNFFFFFTFKCHLLFSPAAPISYWPFKSYQTSSVSTEMRDRQRSFMSVLTKLPTRTTAREHLKWRADQNKDPVQNPKIINLSKSFHLFCQLIQAHTQEMEINTSTDCISCLLSLSSETLPGTVETKQSSD